MVNWRKPIIYSLLYLSGSKIPQNLAYIKSVEYKAPQELKRLQEEKLKNILWHAYKNVSYYNQVLPQAGVVKNDRIDLSRFSDIPILTKDILRKEFENLKSQDIAKRKWEYNSSGGSTGEPVRFIQDKEYKDWNFANKIYYKTFGRQDIGEREIRLWGSERDIMEGKEKLSIRLRNWLYNRREYNAFRMDKQGMLEFAKEWNKFKPAWVESYVQSIYEFAKLLKKKNIKVHTPKGIITSAGILYPEMKNLIEEVFGCNTYNRYGSREVGDVACSCERQEGLHLSPWNHYCEVINGKNNKSGNGEIIVTTLNNYAMPLIRYKIGDLAQVREAACSCGRGMPLLRKITGREINIFRSQEGELIDGEYFTHLFYLRDWCKKFQVIQKDYKKIVINIVKTDIKETNFEKDKKEINAAIYKVMGADCGIEWNLVIDIQPTESGKYLYTISELK